jgi:hypothetical protein
MAEFPYQHPTSQVSRISEGTAAYGVSGDVVDLIDALLEEAAPPNAVVQSRRRNDASQESLITISHVSGYEHIEEAGFSKKPTFVFRLAGRSRFAD